MVSFPSAAVQIRPCLLPSSSHNLLQLMYFVPLVKFGDPTRNNLKVSVRRMDGRTAHLKARSSLPQESPQWNSTLCNSHGNISTACTAIVLVWGRAVVLQSRLRVKSSSSGKLIPTRSVIERCQVQWAPRRLEGQEPPPRAKLCSSTGPAPVAYTADDLFWPKRFIVSQQSCTRSTTTKHNTTTLRG